MDKLIYEISLLLLENGKILSYKNYNKLKLNILKIYEQKFTENNITYKQQISIINDIFNNMFDTKYKIKLAYTPINLQLGLTTPNNYNKIEKQFNKLKVLPQFQQRTPEWFKYRSNKITASDTAAAIDMNPYEPVEAFILKKCETDPVFSDNATVFFGRKYEPIATLIYENIFNVKVEEFGAIPSEKYPFLGASPDGICTKYTLDNKFSNKFGTMLEIKCPVTRQIKTYGSIINDMCPFYYYCQVQQQLECCELNDCDFWQCKFIEYESRDEYLLDECDDSINTETSAKGETKTININNNLKKGLFLEFYPINNIKGEPEWNSKYIIPENLNLTADQYDNFSLSALDTYKNKYQDIYNNYTFKRVIYWKLIQSHNVSIEKNESFINNIVPILEKTWNSVLYYREHLNELDRLKKIIIQRKKYIQHKTSFNDHTNYLKDKKILFLDDTVNIKKVLDEYKNKDSDVADLDFIDE